MFQRDNVSLTNHYYYNLVILLRDGRQIYLANGLQKELMKPTLALHAYIFGRDNPRYEPPSIESLMVAKAVTEMELPDITPGVRLNQQTMERA